MIEIRRALGVALWLTLTLVCLDLARIVPASLPAQAPWSFLAEAARMGLAAYGAASLGLLGALAAALLILPRLRAGAPARPTLHLHAGAGVALLVGSSGLSAMGERRGAPGWMSASWAVDAQMVALLAIAAGWGASIVVARCLRAHRPALLLGALALLPAAPAILASSRLLAAAGLPAAARAAAGGGLPDVVLVVADTLRADALSCYGGAGRPTPVLDALAASGARFERAVAQASWTNPSVASILTSLHPVDHGMRGHRGRIRDEARSLAQVLASNGYATAGLVANPLVSRSYGFDRGFAHWDQDPDHHPGARHPNLLLARLLRAAGRGRPEAPPPRAGEMVDRALAWLAAHPGGPRFLYLHLMDPHDPYDPPRGFGPAAGPPGSKPLRMDQGTLYRILRGEIPLIEGDVRRARALYDAEVAYMDREIGRLLEALREPVESGRAVVAFTSDHGEEFMEHGTLGHEHTLYEELIHVPLVVARQGIVPAGSVVGRPVRHVDLAPTILELAGLPPEPAFEGRSLLPLIRGEDGGGSGEPLASEEDYIGYRTTSHRIRSARDGPWKVILYSPNAFGIGPWRREAFDLSADPGETASLPPGREEVDRLESWLRERTARREDGGVEAQNLDPETERRLRALGYVH